MHEFTEHALGPLYLKLRNGHFHSAGLHFRETRLTYEVAMYVSMTSVGIGRVRSQSDAHSWRGFAEVIHLHRGGIDHRVYGVP